MRFWETIVLTAPSSGFDACECAARVLNEPALARAIHTVHLSPSEQTFVVQLPRTSDSRAADELAYRRAFRAAWRGVSLAELDVVERAEREARRREFFARDRPLVET